MPQQARQPQMPSQAFGGMRPQMPMGGIPQLTMPTQAQGLPQGMPFGGQMPQRPPQAFGGQAPQGILSGGQSFPQAPQMQMDPARLQMILQLLAQRRQG